jgi:hypothetical protein
MQDAIDIYHGVAGGGTNFMRMNRMKQTITQHFNKRKLELKLKVRLRII